MRTAVWVDERPDDVVALLRRRGARSRRAVVSPNGVLVLGPAPESLTDLRLTLRVVTASGRQAIGFAWTGDTAWVLVRAGGKASGLRFGPDRSQRFAAADGVVPPRVVKVVARAFHVTPRRVRAAVDESSGRGLSRLVGFLKVMGLQSEARLLTWAEEAGPGVVPVHPRRWWEWVAGEYAHSGSFDDETVVGRHAPLRFAAAGLPFVAGPAVYPAVSGVLGPWGAATASAVLTLIGACATAAAVVLTAREKRVEPFPLSDPLGVLEAIELYGVRAGTPGEPERALTTGNTTTVSSDNAGVGVPRNHTPNA